MTITLLHGDCRDKLRDLADRSVQCIVTSPPYYGLRRYDVDGQQIGLEQSPAEYVAALVAVFRECRRVLRDDGVLWVNLGDSYAAGGMSNPSAKSTLGGGKDRGAAEYSISRRVPDIPEKNLLGIPWRVAFALQDDGWILRSDIIWSKPNPMPESVTDRPTRAHEYLFLFAKSPRYYYDAQAIAETASAAGRIPGGNRKVDDSRNDANRDMTIPVAAYRNRRTVWTVATRPYSGAHFAVFPEQLIAPCILAGSASQACERCGAPWERVVERAEPSYYQERKQRQFDGRKVNGIDNYTSISKGRPENSGVGYSSNVTTGFRPTCRCDALGSARSIVLDPFVGSGTTCRVAEQYGRDSIGIDLGYSDIQAERTDGIQKVMVDLL